MINSSLIDILNQTQKGLHMSRSEKLRNIFAFLSILFAEDERLGECLMGMSPDYLLEKWERYVEGMMKYDTGMHPNLRREFFDRYFERWGE